MVLILILCGVVLVLGVIGYSLYLANINQKTNDNVDRINNLIQGYMQEFHENGVSSIEKKGWALKVLPKNEILYGQFNSEFTRIKYLQSGAKETIEGRGITLVSDKAITISSSLQSGKRRYLYKNFGNNLPSPVRNQYGTEIAFIYNGKQIHVNTDDFRGIIMAFHLLNNPIRDENSITF